MGTSGDISDPNRSILSLTKLGCKHHGLATLPVESRGKSDTLSIAVFDLLGPTRTRGSAHPRASLWPPTARSEQPGGMVASRHIAGAAKGALG